MNINITKMNRNSLQEIPEREKERHTDESPQSREEVKTRLRAVST